MNKKRTVVLAQLPIPPANPHPFRGNVPLAAGYLKLYAELNGLGEHFDIEILPAEAANTCGDQSLLGEILARDPALVGFTCYLWNIERTLWLAHALKERKPDVRIVIGGPEITRDNDWVLQSGVYDFAVIGEGEQTFAELLAHLAGTGGTLSGITGLAYLDGELRFAGARVPLKDISPISSPYLAGILNAGDQEQLLLETIRGCIFKCKFCYYPKAYDGIYYVSDEKILANLAHAREQGAKEVYLLDPTLNQRRDFGEFLKLLKSGNPDGQLEYYAELRGEGIKPEHARLMREANFKEVEIGLQSTDAKTQELMDRRNNLQAFERGVRALQEEGVRVKVDLIVGLPGDTQETVVAGMRYLKEQRLYDDMQVFQLSILPGTSFREEAAALGLSYQQRPPYYVLRTPTFAQKTMLGLLHASEEIFETTFDPVGAPALDLPLEKLEEPRQGIARALQLELDDEMEPDFTPICSRAAQTFTLWLRSANFYKHLDTIQKGLRELLVANPFTTLQLVLDAEKDFPLNVYDGILKACRRPVNLYLDRFYEFTPGSGAGALRLVTLVPPESESRIDPDWVYTATASSEFVYRDDDTAGKELLEVEGRIWRWVDPNQPPEPPMSEDDEE